MKLQLTIVKHSPIRQRIHNHIETMVDIVLDMLENPGIVDFKYTYFQHELEQVLQFCDYTTSEADQFEICILWQIAHKLRYNKRLVWPISSKFYTRSRS